MASQKTVDLGAKLVRLEQALASIRPGNRIYLGTGCAAPRSLLAGLEAMQPGPPDLELVSFVTTSALPTEAGAPRTRYRHRAFFVGSDVRSLAGSGQLDYVPISLEEVPRLLTSGRLPIDVALLQVSPPDARGFVSLGVSVDLAPAVLSVARRVIAEVNPAMPRTHGDSFVHLDRFDALVQVDAPVTEYRHPETGEIAERVARYIASIIDDGSTLQIGLGRVPNEALRHLRDRRDLGIHSDVITDGIVDLVEAGVVTGRRKTRHRDRIVASYCLGTRRLYDFVDDNPRLLFLPIDQVCDPEEVAANRAHGLDHPGLRDRPDGPGLRRPVRRRVLRRRLDAGGLHPGRGALRRRQADHLPGVHHRRWRLEDQALAGGRRRGGDRALRRALRDHRVRHRLSVREVDPGAGGRADRDRASALARGAADGGQATGLRPAEQYLASQAAYPVHEERTVELKNGAKVLIRPARAADAGALQALFHRLSPDDVYTRFFRRVRSLSYAELQTLCNVNHETEVAFLGVTGPRENEEVVGSACYFLSPTTNLAEVAFMVAPEWQGAGLGTALQARLQEYAISRGVRGFVAEILPRNASMLRLAARAPGTVTTARDEDAVHVTILFDRAPDDEAAPAPPIAKP